MIENKQILCCQYQQNKSYIYFRNSYDWLYIYFISYHIMSPYVAYTVERERELWWYSGYLLRRWIPSKQGTKYSGNNKETMTKDDARGSHTGNSIDSLPSPSYQRSQHLDLFTAFKPIHTKVRGTVKACGASSGDNTHQGSHCCTADTDHATITGFTGTRFLKGVVGKYFRVLGCCPQPRHDAPTSKRAITWACRTHPSSFFLVLLGFAANQKKKLRTLWMLRDWTSKCHYVSVHSSILYHVLVASVLLAG